ncbi:MAG TPA: phytanoyl-CoA dioxygenase family protein [Acidimicrobiales bacterium]|jgi:ectoine hydroxylase-related dioxygenase (phytanoyl-CoA dioxygenase family)
MTVTVDRLPGDSVQVDDVVASLEEQGYSLIERMLSEDEVTAKRDELARLSAETPKGRNDFEGFDTRRVYALFGKSRMFDDLALHPLLTGAADKLLEYYQLSAPVGLTIGPGETRQPIHTDDLIYPLPWPHQHVVLNTIVALCDFTEANGGTRIVPGSHRWPRTRRPTEAEAIPVEMPAGSALTYVGTTWHGGGANTTDQVRPSILVEYVAAWLRPQESQLLVVPPEVVRNLPQRLQELLGYNIYPPFVGYVDGRHPRHTLP